MQHKNAWLSLASTLLLACNNTAPIEDSADAAGASAALDRPGHACQLGQVPVEPTPEQTRGLYEASTTADAASALPCGDETAGSYGIRVELDVFAPATAEHDPSRGRASLLLHAQIDAQNDVSLRLCGLALPARYAYATSAVSELQLPDEVFERESMPVWQSRLRARPDGAMQLDAFPMLLGIALREPDATWPSFDQTTAIDCGRGEEGAACFPDHDGELPSQRLAACVHELSEGNPLCIAELARHVTRGDLPQLTQTSSLERAVPERISQAVRLQLASLPPETVEALMCASALGRSFAQPLLAQLLGISELQLLERLTPALACGMLRPTSAELSFAHALVRNAVYAELSPHRRAQLHQRIAELLEQRADPSLLPLFELAHHYYLAAVCGRRLKAIEFAARAACHAAEMRAYETAAELHERAFALSQLEGVSSLELLTRAFSAGAACYSAGQFAQAVHYFDRAAEIARLINAPQAVADAVAAGCFVLRGTLLFDRTRQQLVRDALAALPEGDNPIRAAMLAVGCLAEPSQDALGRRRAAAYEGIAMARRLGEPLLLAQALSSGHHALWGAVHPDELLAIANELVAVARTLPDSELLLDALIWRISDSAERGDGLTLDSDCAEYLALLDEHYSGWHRYMAIMLQCMQESCLGNFAAADALSLKAAELGERQREPSARSFFALRQLFRWLDGRVDCPDGCELDPPADLPAPYHALWLIAWVRCGRERQARQALRTARERGFENIPVGPLHRPTLAIYAMSACELGDLDSAEALYGALSEHNGLHIALQSGVYLGPVAYYLGMLAAKLERPNSAVQHFETALSACRNLRSCSGIWRIQQAYARMLLDLTRRGATASSGSTAPEHLLAQALQLAEQIDCEPWQKQTQALMRDIQRIHPRLTQVAG